MRLDVGVLLIAALASAVIGTSFAATPPYFISFNLRHLDRRLPKPRNNEVETAKKIGTMAPVAQCVLLGAASCRISSQSCSQLYLANHPIRGYPKFVNNLWPQRWNQRSAAITELLNEDEMEKLLIHLKDNATRSEERKYLQADNRDMQSKIRASMNKQHAIEAMRNVLQDIVQTPLLPAVVFSSALEWVRKTFGREDNRLPDRLVDLRPTGVGLNMPRQGRSGQIKAIWQQFVEADRARKPLVFISGVAGSGKTSVARYFAEKQVSDISNLPNKERAFAEDTQMIVISFNGDTGATPLDKRWIKEDQYFMPVVARVLFRQQSSNITFDAFCSSLDVAFKDKQLGTKQLDIVNVLPLVVDMTKPAVLIVDELGKLGGELVEIMRSYLCRAMDNAMIPDFFVLFTTLHSGLMKDELASSNRPVFPITLPALTFEKSKNIFMQVLQSETMWHNEATRKLVSSYLSTVSGGHPRSIQLLLAVAQHTDTSLPLSSVTDKAAVELTAWYPKLYEYPPELLYHVFLCREVEASRKPFANHPGHELAKFTFDDLVASGRLFNSLNSEKFQPMLNLLALRVIARQSDCDPIVASALQNLIRIIDTFDPQAGVDFETVHMLSEQLRRYSAFKLNELRDISIWDYYGRPTRTRGKLMHFSAQFNKPVDLLCEDAIPSPNNSDLPRIRFNPNQQNFPGMDGALFVPTRSGFQAMTTQLIESTTNTKLTKTDMTGLVVQYKFSKPGSAKVLDKDTVNKSYQHGAEKMAAAGWKTSQYVHIIVAWDRPIADNALKDFPEDGDRHIMILDKSFNKLLAEMYGPGGFFLGACGFLARGTGGAGVSKFATVERSNVVTL